MKLKTIYSVMTLILSLSACQSDENHQKQVKEKTIVAQTKDPLTKTEVKNINELYHQATQTLLKFRVFSATQYGLTEKNVGLYFKDKVEDYSPEIEQKLRKSLFALSEKIKNYPLQSNQQIEKDNQEVMANLTRYFAGDANFPVGYIDTWMGLSPFVVNQINGPLIDIPRAMQNAQTISNEKDALDYIERLNQFDDLIASLQAKLAFDVKQNWIAPKIILNGALRYFDNFLKTTPENHPLTKNIQEKINKLNNISIDRKKELINLAAEKVKSVVYPAYHSIAKQTRQLVDSARKESGIWAQPNGAQYYQNAILNLGDSHLTAEQIHQIGINEVDRINLEMDKILQVQGYKKGSVGARMIALSEEPKFLYPDNNEGRKQLLSDLNSYIDEISQKMSGLFKTKPKYRVEVRSFPVEIQEGSPGGQYSPPSIDGSQPGIYWINLRDMKANPKFSLKTLTYHEANPGHHWQIALNMEQDSLPFLRRIAPYNAYIEGWALYSEKVAEEMGLYQNDPFGNLGRLQAELFRAVRLVVDTGLHHKRWSREQAIEYMSDKTGSAKSDVVSEIERYMAWPGQALGYKLGMLKILELREKAQKSLKEKFDLATFHDLILLGGAVPMKVLERKVDNWITQQKN